MLVHPLANSDVVCLWDGFLRQEDIQQLRTGRCWLEKANVSGSAFHIGLIHHAAGCISDHKKYQPASKIVVSERDTKNSNRSRYPRTWRNLLQPAAVVVLMPISLVGDIAAACCHSCMLQYWLQVPTPKKNNGTTG